MLLVNPSGLPGINPAMTLDSGSVATGQAFLQGELEKLNPVINEPLMSVTWPRDIVVKTGGGYVDFTSNFFVDYGTAGANQYGLIAGETNNLPLIQGNVSKDVFPVFTFGYIVKVPFLDQARMTQVGRSLENILTNGLRKNYDKTLDQNVYLGFPNVGTFGIVNNPGVTQTVAPLNSGATSRKWRDKTPTEILDDVNSLINLTWAQSEYDLTGMANHILIPPDDFNYINGTLVSNAGNMSILAFLQQFNTAKAQGRDLVIAPCRQCIDAGDAVASGEATSGRMVAYVNAEDRLCFDETVPLTRIITQPSAEQVAYLSTYVAKVGVVKFLYFQCAAYMDGIS